MERNTRIQTWCGIGTVVSLPILYVGAMSELIAMEILGFALFAVSILTTPALRFVPMDTPETEPGDSATTEEGPAEDELAEKEASRKPGSGV